MAKKQKPIVINLDSYEATQIRETTLERLATLLEEQAQTTRSLIGLVQSLPLVAIKGNIASWGPKNKYAVDVTSGIPVDFFAAPELGWWVSLVIRTGSKETNLRLTMGAQRLRRQVSVELGAIIMEDGSIRYCTEEEEVFELCGVPYLEPRAR